MRKENRLLMILRPVFLSFCHITWGVLFQRQRLPKLKQGGLAVRYLLVFLMVGVMIEQMRKLGNPSE